MSSWSAGGQARIAAVLQNMLAAVQAAARYAVKTLFMFVGVCRGTNARLIMNEYQYWRLVSSMFVNAGAIQVWASLTTAWVYSSFLANVLHPAEIGEH